ncbi:hypothetical protein [Fusibacter ferrireducens]|uniref:SLH domain-containing protein n=1 Tax=Fusibacter ferrireducens TaxID=2785058 RepID=A0ABR9ZTW7_9FIRM|nr:hypothetical protein [Fusibacter ferrireducens]MBF4693890.1 hypothetical protein [Fusibacter ferrireducens]
MIKEEIVKIVAKRIMNNGVNPKTGKPYVADDITNKDYKKAVNRFIQENAKNGLKKI